MFLMKEGVFKTKARTNQHVLGAGCKVARKALWVNEKVAGQKAK